MAEIGYVRVSSAEQNEDRQLIALKRLGVRDECIYMDKQSGSDFVRPQYQKMLSELSEGDVLYVTSIDRLGRNYEEIQNQWRIITKKMNVDICVLDMPLLDTRVGKDLIGTFIADIVLQILSFCAESERKNIHERQKQGIAAAKDRGVVFGRPKVSLPDNFMDIVCKWKKGLISADEAAGLCDISRSTFYRRVKILCDDKLCQ